MSSVQQGPRLPPGEARFGGTLEKGQRVRPGTVRRIIPYAKNYRWTLALLLVVSAIGALITVVNPLLLGMAIDKGVLPRKMGTVVLFAGLMIGLALVEAATEYLQVRASAQIGQGLVYDLRTEVFTHVQKQPLAFFTRSQTGSLVSRLNTDVVGAQSGITKLLSGAVNTLLTLVLVLAAMFYLSWQVTVAALLMTPLFILPGRIFGHRLQRLARRDMELNAELGSMMNERFNIAGAMLSKLFGRPETESRLFSGRAAAIRDIGVKTNVSGQMLGIVMQVTGAVTLGILFGLGGSLVVNGAFEVGTLVSLTLLVTRMYDPIIQLSNLQANAMSALVSFDRVFEVLELKPLVAERPGATPLPPHTPGNGAAPDIEFEQVSFRYPSPKEVSLASLESIALPAQERSEESWVLEDVSFRAPPGKLTALVGHSGAGKTTITHLVPRFYDPGSGSVRIGGRDIRDVTTRSLRDTIGVVTQDAHLFHDTIRANLLYARPEATEAELVEVCEAARIWELIESLANGLDTVVGDRGYRLSGGEKQRIALARLLLKAPPIVVLDEATAHLDSESEAAIQRALKTALAGRTSLVIAHRLSTIRDADQILLIDEGRIRERGTHDELLAAGGMYADLYLTQFAGQETTDSKTTA